MENTLKTAPQAEKVETAPPYEAPKIESVLTPEGLEREVHYAGIQQVSGGQGL